MDAEDNTDSDNPNILTCPTSAVIDADVGAPSFRSNFMYLCNAQASCLQTCLLKLPQSIMIHHPRRLLFVE